MLRTLVAAIAALLLAGCGAAAGSSAPSSPAPPPSSAPPAALDPIGPWQLTAGSVNGQPLGLVEGSRVTLIVDGSNVSGQSACNQYFGEFTVVDGRVTLGGLGGTEMACPEPIMTLESAYLQGLAAVEAAHMAGDELVLTGPGVELRYERLETPPTAELVDTEWVLESLVQNDAVASTIGEPATLVLHDDGTVDGSTGCRTLSGRYVVNGDEIEFTEFAADGECAGGPAEQDAHVIDVLEGGFRAAVDGRQLTLNGDGGQGLIYQATE
jgi:heat shock protein HslJ